MIPKIFEYQSVDVIDDETAQYYDCEINTAFGEFNVGDIVDYVVWNAEEGLLSVCKDGNEYYYRIDYSFEEITNDHF